MAETGRPGASDGLEMVTVCVLLPWGPGTRLLSPPVPGLGLGEQDVLGLTVSATCCGSSALTHSGDRCAARAEPEVGDQALP